ncbi:MAG: hypothetical protein J5588_06000 [Bacteroidales bacterium]|nr:hypothetical protein [Bacteroidales bacterium]
MTVQDGLRSINEYPIKGAVLSSIATLRGITLTAELTEATMKSKAYRLATADVYKFIAFAPNISQGGVSVSFTDAQRNEFKRIANSIYGELGEETVETATVFGYKGSSL